MQIQKSDFIKSFLQIIEEKLNNKELKEPMNPDSIYLEQALDILCKWSSKEKNGEISVTKGANMDIVIPLNKKVIVEPEAAERKTPTGIIIPDSAQAKAPTKGRVIAIAEDSEINLKVKEGDTVLFSKFAGTEIVLVAKTVDEKDRKLQIIKDEDILAVVRKGGA